MDSRIRGNDKLQDGPAFFVVPAQAGTHRRGTDWIPAYAESTPRIEKKYSGGNDRLRDSRAIL